MYVKMVEKELFGVYEDIIKEADSTDEFDHFHLAILELFRLLEPFN